MENLDQRTYGLLFDIQRSVRYHMRRRAFFENWNTLTSVLTLIGASSALSLFLTASTAWLGAVITAMIGLVAALDALVGTARLANQHATLAQQFIGLERCFARGNSLDDAEHETVVRQRLEIESYEPPVKRLLDLLCDLEVRRAHGNETQNPPIPWLRRITAHWFNQVEFAQSLHDHGDASA